MPQKRGTLFMTIFGTFSHDRRQLLDNAKKRERDKTFARCARDIARMSDRDDTFEQKD
jgi:hypothetical protein